ncbi:pollen-specific leucine-rich repeat extensin-like protein 1 [Arapaima gigas]
MQLTTLVVSMAGVSTLGLIFILHWQHKETEEMIKLASYLAMKLRVTRNALNETQAALELLEDKAEELKTLRWNQTNLKNKLAAQNENLTHCHLEKQELAGELRASLLKRSQIEAQLYKDRKLWTLELNTLKENMSENSKMCNFVKMSVKKTMKLCTGINKTDDSTQKKKI